MLNTLQEEKQREGAYSTVVLNGVLKWGELVHVYHPFSGGEQKLWVDVMEASFTATGVEQNSYS